jgi:septal ring factor EnvC (AmiA/AmiB activator)
MRIVKQLLFTFAFLGIFFLTGCAGERYHTKVVDAGRVSPASRVPSSYQNAVFLWPIHGDLIVSYGQKEDGVSVKGIVISGREGDTVKAVADGFVAYADPSLRGHGQTIVVDHRNGFSSVYARTAELMVSLGQEVRQGQSLARLGRSGKGLKPELYLEIRKNSRAENPLSYLR